MENQTTNGAPVSAISLFQPAKQVTNNEKVEKTRPQASTTTTPIQFSDPRDIAIGENLLKMIQAPKPPKIITRTIGKHDVPISKTIGKGNYPLKLSISKHSQVPLQSKVYSRPNSTVRQTPQLARTTVNLPRFVVTNSLQAQQENVPLTHSQSVNVSMASQMLRVAVANQLELPKQNVETQMQLLPGNILPLSLPQEIDPEFGKLTRETIQTSTRAVRDIADNAQTPPPPVLDAVTGEFTQGEVWTTASALQPNSPEILDENTGNFSNASNVRWGNTSTLAQLKNGNGSTVAQLPSENFIPALVIPDQPVVRIPQRFAPYEMKTSQENLMTAASRRNVVSLGSGANNVKFQQNVAQLPRVNAPLQIPRGNVPIAVHLQRGNVPITMQICQENILTAAPVQQGNLATPVQQPRRNISTVAELIQRSALVPSQLSHNGIPFNSQLQQIQVQNYPQLLQGNQQRNQPVTAQIQRGQIPITLQMQQPNIANVQIQYGNPQVQQPNIANVQMQYGNPQVQHGNAFVNAQFPRGIVSRVNIPINVQNGAQFQQLNIQPRNNMQPVIVQYKQPAKTITTPSNTHLPRMCPTRSSSPAIFSNNSVRQNSPAPITPVLVQPNAPFVISDNVLRMVNGEDSLRNDIPDSTVDDTLPQLRRLLSLPVQNFTSPRSKEMAEDPIGLLVPEVEIVEDEVNQVTIPLWTQTKSGLKRRNDHTYAGSWNKKLKKNDGKELFAMKDVVIVLDKLNMSVIKNGSVNMRRVRKAKLFLPRKNLKLGKTTSRKPKNTKAPPPIYEIIDEQEVVKTENGNVNQSIVEEQPKNERRMKCLVYKSCNFTHVVPLEDVISIPNELLDEVGTVNSAMPCQQLEELLSLVSVTGDGNEDDDVEPEFEEMDLATTTSVTLKSKLLDKLASKFKSTSPSKGVKVNKLRDKLMTALAKSDR